MAPTTALPAIAAASRVCPAWHREPADRAGTLAARADWLDDLYGDQPTREGMRPRYDRRQSIRRARRNDR